MIQYINITKSDVPNDYKFTWSFITSHYYDITYKQNGDNTNFLIELKQLENPVLITNQELIFSDYKGNIHCYCVKDSELIIGILTFIYNEWNNSVFIYDLYLLDNYKNNGFGTRLINIVKEYAKEVNARIICLETQTTNYPAIAFYQKNGFKITGINITKFTNNDIHNKNVYLEMGYIRS